MGMATLISYPRRIPQKSYKARPRALRLPMSVCYAMRGRMRQLGGLQMRLYIGLLLQSECRHGTVNARGIPPSPDLNRVDADAIQVSWRLTPAEYDDIRACAERARCSPSEWVRRAIYWDTRDRILG